jgi:hypothetical protein
MPIEMPSTAFTTTLPGATKVLRRFSMANMELTTLSFGAEHRGEHGVSPLPLAGEG